MYRVPIRLLTTPTEANEPALPRAEWDFDGIPEREELGCMVYELLRESPTVRSHASELLLKFRELLKERGINSDAFFWPGFNSFAEDYTSARLSILTSMAMLGFPEKPWREITDDKMRGNLNEALFWWRYMPSALESKARADSLVSTVCFERLPETQELLKGIGVEYSSHLHLSSKPLPEESPVLVVDPRATDEEVLQALHRLREITGNAYSHSAPKQDGRKPNHKVPRMVLESIGLMRTAYYLPGKVAWKLAGKQGTLNQANVAISRARDVCLDAIHAHFDLPQDEKPVHFNKSV